MTDNNNNYIYLSLHELCNNASITKPPLNLLPHTGWPNTISNRPVFTDVSPPLATIHSFFLTACGHNFPVRPKQNNEEKNKTYPVIARSHSSIINHNGENRFEQPDGQKSYALWELIRTLEESGKRPARLIPSSCFPEIIEGSTG